jgi:hypothetical protein
MVQGNVTIISKLDRPPVISWLNICFLRQNYPTAKHKNSETKLDDIMPKMPLKPSPSSHYTDTLSLNDVYVHRHGTARHLKRMA